MSHVTIYSKSVCPYCVRAKALFDKIGIAYNEVRIDLHEEKRDEMLQKSNGSTTVPQIFIGDKHIGGCDELYALHANGRLMKLLA
ncbi:MAG: glutaredoxin 3 [Alphaproteobacteria bacterium]|nr:MAG: glutaredoxin 3 [Alphaproteobacteria bacterium]